MRKVNHLRQEVSSWKVTFLSKKKQIFLLYTETSSKIYDGSRSKHVNIKSSMCHIVQYDQFILIS